MVTSEPLTLGELHLGHPAGLTPGDRWLHVLVVTDDEPAVARLLGSVRVAVESTGDDRHDCIHAILEASDGLSTGQADIEPPGRRHG